MDKQDIKVSVIIPIYKVEGYLDKCVLSVINQTYSNIEIILVDDGSPDNCPQICDKYKALDSRVVVVRKKNGGLSDARNAGLDVATGEYISFLDGDDTLDSKAVEVLVNTAKQTSSSIVKMQFRNVYEGDDIPDTDVPKVLNGNWIKNADYIKAICTYKASCSCCDKLFHRSVINNYRFKKGRTNEDLLFLGTMLLEQGCNIYSLNYQGYNYLQRQQSITKTKFGTSIRDTVYNCAELQELAKEKREDVYVYFRMLSLYQARTFLLLMPKSYIKLEHEDFVFAMKTIKTNKEIIWKSFFSLKDKLFLSMCLLNISFAKAIAGER